MAAHLDLAARLERLGVAEEVYAGDPPALLAKVATMARQGKWPIAINVKGARPDDVLIVLTLAGFEAMNRTGFEAADA